MRARIEQGGAPKYHEAAAEAGKLFARERIALLIDEGSFAEDGRYANVLADGLPADGVVTGTATIDGRPVALMANDSTVKAGSWGARTVEKIIRIIEKAYRTGLPMVYLVDSAGARITDQVEMFPGRPSTVAVPVITPSAGSPSASTFAYRPSSVKLPSSISSAIRSRANSLPAAAAASWYLPAPPCSTWARSCARSECSATLGTVPRRGSGSRGHRR